MRLRHKPKAVKALPNHPFYIETPKDCRGVWQEEFSARRPLSLELGCGFGRFSCEFAKRFSNKNLIAVDKSRDVLVGSCRQIEEELGKDVANLRVCNFDAYDIETFFSKDDGIEELYIFFCNPWPKRSHNRRRLTYPSLLLHYKNIMVPSAKIFFKTDDEMLYRYSLKYFDECNFTVLFKTEDLDDNSGYEVLSIRTEYEQKFRSYGQNIYAAVVEVK